MSDRLHLALGKFVAHWALIDHELVIGIHHMALSANHKLETDPRGAPLAPERAKKRQAIFEKLLKSLSQDKALTGLSDKVLGTIARLRGRR
ncbi:hypothetical protein LP414_16690 [Polaromonas sp. P1(28)-13]|nr:hypothetical protein LP414_16690 [Polaromonas sp. P1(28)-13]